MEITGKRRLIFGMFTVLVVAVVEVIKTNGWSKVGAVVIIMTVAFFYGERMVDSIKGLVEAVKGKFGKKIPTDVLLPDDPKAIL